MYSKLNEKERKQAMMLAAEIKVAADVVSVRLIKTENAPNNLGVTPELAISAHIIVMRGQNAKI